jgi:hypothetical protein
MSANPEQLNLACHTRSNAAIFLLFTWSLEAEVPCSGAYFATRRVAGESTSGLRSVQVIGSFAFWDTGVKKVATAFPT